jgi:2-dehydro-3-deoxygluconokinase
MTARLICFGEMLVRLTAPRGETLLQTPALSAHFGGAEANVAVCVARLGGSAAMASVLPDNAIGRAARDDLRRHGVDTSPIRFAPGRMGLYFMTPGAVIRPAEILYDRAGSAFADARVDAIDWSAVLSGGEWLHVSGITPAVSANGEAMALAAVTAARKAGLKISFDGNYRAKLWAARGETGARILRELLASATLAFVDERDLSLVLGGAFNSRADAATAAFAAFPQLRTIAATSRATHSASDYALGADVFTRSGSHSVDAVKLPGVVDRVGGGDAFAGGFLYALMAGMNEEAALRFALYASIAKHGQTGDALNASADEILALMSSTSADIRR